MKVAVVMHGHVRTFDRVKDSFYKNVVEKFSPDIYMHCWTNRGFKKETAERNKHTDHGTVWFEDAPIPLEEILHQYKPVSFVCEQYSNVKNQIEQLTKPVYEWRDSLSGTYHNYMINGFVGQFYGRYMANELRKKSNVQYDMVIIIRPDVQIYEIPEEVQFNLNKVVYCVESYGQREKAWIREIMFICSSVSANVICNVYPTYHDIFESVKQRNEPHLFFEPHNLFHARITEFGYEIKDIIAADILR